ncbi:MAG: hypothetical protein QOI05_4587 [Bradyrhizobium sp.]|nr:hypothetical protein [Bradyrhizobium sp.]
MALISESSVSGRGSRSDVGREQAACRVQSSCDAICVRRQTDEPAKMASEPLPRHAGKRRNSADFQIRLRYEIRERHSLATASHADFRRNLVRRPSCEPVSIHPFTALQPVRRREDVYSPRGQRVIHQLNIQIQADCAERARAQRFMRHGWVDHRSLASLHGYPPNRSKEYLLARQHNGDLNLIVEMGRKRRARVTAPSGLFDAAPVVATGIRPCVCDLHKCPVHSRRAHDVQILQQAQFRRSVVGTFRKRRNSDLRILGVAAGLPRLPDLEFAIYEKPRPDKAAAALLTLAQEPSRPAI